jgi:hypothetical protein
MWRGFKDAAQFTGGTVAYNNNGKVHLRKGHEGPEEEEEVYSCTLSSTSALDGGGWSTPRPGGSTPGKAPVPICGGGGTRWRSG